MSFTAPGSFPVLEEIRKIYDQGNGNLSKDATFGNVSHVRGIVIGILMTEAIKTAQDRFGKGKVVSAEQVRWGYENLNLDDARLKAIGAFGLLPPTRTTCLDHEGSGATMVQQWDGTKFVRKSDGWITGDRALVRKLAEQSAEQYASEKGAALRDCSKEP